MDEPSAAEGATRLASLVKTAPPFVGRREELAWLEKLLQECRGGQPRVVMLPGDAGIGKTRLLQEVRSRSLQCGLQVGYGRGYEDLTLPYLPIVEVFHGLIDHISDDLERTIGADIEVIRWLLHRDQASAQVATSFPSAQSDQDKFRLFFAVSHTIIALAHRRPTVIIVDDLHWADRSSIDLFGHLVFTVADAVMREQAPLLIIGSYRPVEPETHLSRLIARVQRETICQSFTLPGLNEAEIHELVQGLGLLRPSHQLIATVSGATHGNPLFIQEVLHHLMQEDALRERGGYVVATVAAADLRLPDQLTGAIVRRMHQLSEEWWRILTMASFLGDHFSLRDLAAVSGVGEDELLNSLEEGMRQRLLQSDGDAFRFAHSLIRQVFYQEPSPPRRQRIHGQIAATLERLYATDLQAHLLEIAHHLVRAGTAAEASKVAEYARRAGDQALKLFAWGEAAYYYEASLSAAESTGALATQDRADLHYLAAIARLWDGDAGLCRDHYEQAIRGYRELGNMPGLARALMVQARSYNTAVSYGTLADLSPLEEVLSVLGDSEPELRGSILISMSEVYWVGRQPDKAVEMAQRALEIGQNTQNNHLCALASFELGISWTQELYVKEGLAYYEQSRSYAAQAGDRWFGGWPLQRIPTALILLGRFAEAETVAREAHDVASQTNNWRHYSLTLAALACAALAKGDFQAVERHSQETMAIVLRSRYPFGGALVLPAVACAHALRGDWTAAESALNTLIAPNQVFENPGHVFKAMVEIFRQLIWRYQDTPVELDGSQAETLLHTITQERFNLTLLGTYCALVELRALGLMMIPIEPFYEALSQVAERGVCFSRGWLFLIPRILGMAATAIRKWDVAEAQFESAIDTATTVGARPELGRTHLDYATMLLARGRRGDRTRAAGLVTSARALFHELGMEPFIRRTDELANRLRAPGQRGQRPTAEVPPGAGHQPPSAHKSSMGEGTEQSLRIILVTDMVSSTALIQRLGDAKAHELLRTHDSIIRASLRRHDGLEIAHTGDGMEASFLAASKALECAVAIQRAFADLNRTSPDNPIHVRIGLNAGEPIPTEGRLFGTTIHTAFRICTRARSGQILASEVVYQLAAGKGFTFIDRGRAQLRGLSQRVRLYEVRWEGQ